MSTFGEISEPSSRTAWEDWDDVLTSEYDVDLHLEKDIEVPKQIDTFVIIEGRYLYDLVESYHKLELVNASSDAAAARTLRGDRSILRIYRTRNMNNYVCVLKDYNIVLSCEIVNLLVKYITTSNNIISILTKPLVEYQVSEQVSKDYVIRSLSSSKKSTTGLNISFPKLEQPNIISGVSAGVHCWRDLSSKPFVAVVCFIGNPEEQQIPELLDLLEKLNIIPHVEKTHHSTLLNSNLYI